VAQCLVHANFRDIQQMLVQACGDEFQQVLKPDNLSTLACSSQPLCATACQLAKQTRQGLGVHMKHQVPEKKDRLTKDQLLPGQKMSIDQYMLVTHGIPSPYERQICLVRNIYRRGSLSGPHFTIYSLQTPILLWVGETLREENDFE
jgi:hypothetical protein